MDIEIHNARVHNLRGIDVRIPHGSLTVVTGLSGSGKSSLAFDTLYAEGQRRYVESLSAYARQFLDRLGKPDVERIEGLSPAISIEQHTTGGNPRSIVATVTEIHDYLRILYGSIAVAHCPKCGRPVKRQSAEQIVDAILGVCAPGARVLSPSAGASAPVQGAGKHQAPSTKHQRSASTSAAGAQAPAAGASTSAAGAQAPTTRIIIYAPLVKGKKGRHEETLSAVRRNGFARVRVDGTIYPVDEVPELDKKKAHSIDVVVDRLVIPAEQILPGAERNESRASDEKQRASSFRTRLTDSVELALKTGKGVLEVEWLTPAAGAFAPAALVPAVGCADLVPGAWCLGSAPCTSAALPRESTSGEAAKAPAAGGSTSAAGAQAPCTIYSELNACPECGISFDELKPRSFSFNSPFGACPTCAGLGKLYYFDEDLVVPDKSLPLEEAIHPWRRLGGQMAILYHKELLSRIAKQYGVKLSTPYEKLPAKFRHGLMHGFKDDLVLPWRREDRPFEGVLAALQRKRDETEDDEVRQKYDAYQNFRTCPDCHGSRLRPESRAATVAGKSIVEVMAMPVTETLEFFRGFAAGASAASPLVLSRGDAALVQGAGTKHQAPSTRPALPAESTSAALLRESTSPAKLAGLKDVVAEIVKRLQFLLDVGLDYLTLDRAASTLSGGEMQRIRLATQIGSGLTGVLYVLDEPTIGLHPRDNERLISTLKGLRDRGNTVVVVEHDAEMMRAADWIVDLGPGAGREGGNVVYQGDFKGLLKSKSLTADYLTGRKRVVPSPSAGASAASHPSSDRLRGSLRSGDMLVLSRGKAALVQGAGKHQAPSTRSAQPTASTSTAGAQAPAAGASTSAAGAQAPGTKFLTVSGCCEHNLKNVTARFPVGAFTVVTGVSGSGKSTLVDETLKRAMMQKFYRSKDVPGKFRKLSGWENFDKVVEIDQSPIGRTPRSNPATYVGFFSEIRELFAKTEAARARGYTAGRFSFNVKGGRCEACGGDGLQKLEMSFLPDVYVTCEQCGGRRFNAETLEVTYGGKNIAEVLEMTVAEACEFFAKVPSLSRKLKTLADVGLGYIALGQSATTLSGGEAQRIKLATELSRRSTGRTLYLLDEPTTGLHFDDVAKLMKILLELRDQGNTIVVIEHNLDVMRCADWIVDLGPGGGDAGGELVCEGPVEAVRACRRSATGRFL